MRLYTRATGTDVHGAKALVNREGAAGETTSTQKSIEGAAAPPQHRPVWGTGTGFSGQPVPSSTITGGAQKCWPGVVSDRLWTLAGPLFKPLPLGASGPAARAIPVGRTSLVHD